MNPRPGILALAGLAIACLALAVETRACSVPVFRYALERWPADPYRVTVFQREALAPEQSAVVAALRNASEEGLANLAVRTTQVGGEMPPGAAELWKVLPKAELPWVVVQYPAVSGFDQPVAQGLLEAKYVQQLLDSPVRREVRQRILQGDSVVWLLLEGGNQRQDEEVDKLLRAESARLPELLGVPPVDPNDPRTDGNVTLKIAFSVVRLSRGDSAEQSFVSQLVNLHPRLAGAKGPIVFPIFGRGRALCGLAGADLTVENIQQIAVFLTGACSCEVKAMNPGLDLLFAADWDAALEGRAVKDPPMPPLVSLSQLAAQAQPPGPAAEPAVPSSRPSGLLRNLIVAIGLGIVAVVAGTRLLRRRTRM